MASTDPTALHRRARERFFARHGARWPDILYDAFDLLAPRELTRADADEILTAAAAVARVYAAAGRLLHRLSDDALAALGVPDVVLPVVRCAVPGMADCVIGRLDLARTPDGYKLLELNADAPGMLVEALAINAAACDDVGAADPNALHTALVRRALGDAVRAGLRHVGARAPGNVVVAYRRGARRDAGLARYVCELLAELAPRAAARAAASDTLTLDDDGLRDADGRRIDVLYRLFPLPALHDGAFRSVRPSAGDDEHGIYRLVRDGRLALINPPFAFVLASKAVQVLIWQLYEAGEHFTADERQLVARYLLPTTLDPPSGGEPFVAKPVYGSGGDTVRVVDAGGAVRHRAPHSTHTGSPMVYQRYVDLPVEELMTEDGPRRLHLATSCFLVDGVAAGICLRGGDAVTDESAWVIPVCVRD